MLGRAALHRRRDAILRRLPEFNEILRGSLFERHLRCGKPRCHCADGAKHRIFYLSVGFAGGRTEQITVPAKLVPVVRRWLDNYRRWRTAVEEVSAINRELVRRRLFDPTADHRPAPKRGGKPAAPSRE